MPQPRSRKRKTPADGADTAARETGSRPADIDLTAELEHYRRRERELVALQETAIDLNRSRDTNAVLNALVHRIRSVIGADICYLTSYDPERQDFFIRAAVGIISPRFREIRVPKDSGSCRHVVTGLQPFVTSHYAEDPRFVHDAHVDRTLDDEGVIAMAAVPLQLEGRVLGILYVADRHRRKYALHEISLLLSIGAHAALAIENARLFEEARHAVQQLQATMAEVETAIRIHERLIALVASGQGLEALAETMSSALAAGLMLLEPDGHVLCVSAPDASLTAHQRRLVTDGRPIRPLAVALEDSRRSGRSEDVELAGLSCRATAIVSAAQALGALVVWRKHGFTDFDARTLERGALVTGVVLLSRERVARSLNHDFEEALRGLISRNPDAPAAFARHAERRGLDPSQPFALILADTSGRAANLALQNLRADPAFAGVLMGELEGSLVAMGPSGEAAKLAAAIDRALSRRTGAAPTIIVSRASRQLADVPATYATARRCLALMIALGRQGTTAKESELAVYATLFAGASRSDLDDFIRSKIGKLIDYDKARNAQLIESLYCYLKEGLNPQKSAKKLQIHTNTMRQRLQKILYLLDIEEMHHDLFEIQAAVTLQKLAANTI